MDTKKSSNVKTRRIIFKKLKVSKTQSPSGVVTDKTLKKNSDEEACRIDKGC